ncbi:MAG: DUF4271 domain-containing protein [Cytophagaceae bacterium]|nr:DUF4271 domain-containing protein [Cytophagaceae bacterium]
MNFYLEPTYFQQTVRPPQIDIRNLQPVVPALNDSAFQLNIKRTHDDNINIELPAPKPLKQQEPAALPKKAEPVMTQHDSLKFNLTGREGSYTNWNLKPDYYPKSFDESLYSEINEQLLVSSESQNVTADSLIRIESRKQDSLSLSVRTVSTQPDSEIQVSENPLQSNNTFLSLIFVAVLVMGFVRFYRKEYIGNLLRSVFFQGVAANTSANYDSYSFSAFIMGFLFFFNSSLFVYELFCLTGNTFFNSNSLQNIPIIFASLTVLYFTKILVFNLAGYIFDTLPQIKLYLKGTSTMGQAFAIVILPVVVLLPFVNQLGQSVLMNIGGGVFILLYLLQIGRGIKIILKETFSLYYIILYLCALEILPLSILFMVVFE